MGAAISRKRRKNSKLEWWEVGDTILEVFCFLDNRSLLAAGCVSKAWHTHSQNKKCWAALLSSTVAFFMNASGREHRVRVFFFRR